MDCLLISNMDMKFMGKIWQVQHNDNWFNEEDICSSLNCLELEIVYSIVYIDNLLRMN
jgi:hypothetical protein